MSLLHSSSPPLAERMRPSRLEDLVGQEHLPESVILEPIADRLGIGGTDVEKDMRWAQLLASYYNPVTRTPHEVRIRRSKVT